jgi:hypothetical protein
MMNAVKQNHQSNQQTLNFVNKASLNHPKDPEKCDA